MGISTVSPDPPLALVIGTDQPRLAPILAALVAAGYAVTTIAPTDDIAASGPAQAATLTVIERAAGGDTALLTIFRHLRQRPAFAIIEPDGLVFVTGFGTLARGPHPPEALPKLLRTHLGLEEAVVAPTLPLEPEAPVVIAPPPVVVEPLPVIIAPPPVVVKPPPVVVKPPPVAPKLWPIPKPPVGSGLPRGSLRLPVVLVVLVLLVLLSGGFVLMGGFRTAMAPTLTPPTAQSSSSLTLTVAPTTPVTATPPPSATPVATAVLPITNLEIQIVAVSPNPPQVGEVVNVQVRVRNMSMLPITSPFWVDLYDSPTRLPAPPLPWTELAKYGATWRVERLAPGESRELNSLEADPTRSNLLKFDTPGPHRLYVLADTLSELPIARNSGQARPTYLGGPTEIVVGHAPTQP